MQNKNAIYNIISAIFIILLQLFVVRELNIWSVGFCYIYASVLILIPITFSKGYSMLIAFFLGLFIDMFYSTPGVNAFGSVMLIFLKHSLFKNIPTQANFEENDLITPHNFGLINFIVFGFILFFIHRVFIFQLQAYSSAFIWASIYKAFVSALFTLTSTVILFYLMFSTKSRR